MNRILLLAVNGLPGHKGWPKRRIFDSCRDEKDFPDAVDNFMASRSRKSRPSHVTASQLLREADIEIRRLEHHGIGFRCLGDSDYPAALTFIPDPPFLLYYRGKWPQKNNPAVAVVGTRHPSHAASRQAYRLGLELGLADFPVVSGLAFGIDRAAHEGALASGGPTWAVLASGLDRPSPSSHRLLAMRILENDGLLLGEVPPGGFPVRYAFPRRNRILSGLCRACIIVQAPQKSGALITADFALDQGRDLYVGSAGLEGASSEGTRLLEKQGAPVLRRAHEMLGSWGGGPAADIVREVSDPDGPQALSNMMYKELKGNIFFYKGGWFERISA